MSPKIVDKEAKRNEIVHAALKVFAENGMVKTKMVDIAAEAGIGKGTIYEYFRSKEEIFAAGFQLFFEGMQDEITRAIHSTDNPQRQLESLVQCTLNGLLNHGSDFAAVMMDFWAEGIRNKDNTVLAAIDMPRVYEEFRRMLRGILENGIRQGVFRPLNTLHTAAVLIGSLDGIMLQWIMDREVIDIENVADSLLDNFINGIRKA